jgi:hypothetical protein
MWPLLVKEGALNKKPVYDATKHTDTLLSSGIPRIFFFGGGGGWGGQQIQRAERTDLGAVAP